MALSIVSLICIIVGFDFCNVHNNLSRLRIIVYFYSMCGAKLPYASRFFRESDFCLYGVSCSKHLVCRNSIIHSATSHHSKYQNKGRVSPPHPSLVCNNFLVHHVVHLLVRTLRVNSSKSDCVGRSSFVIYLQRSSLYCTRFRCCMFPCR